MIEQRIANLRALGYPEEFAARARARVVRNARGGKVAARNSTVRETSAEIARGRTA